MGKRDEQKITNAKPQKKGYGKDYPSKVIIFSNTEGKKMREGGRKKSTGKKEKNPVQGQLGK